MEISSYFNLSEDIYIIDGAARSAIYDLQQGNLFSISKQVGDLIKTAVKNGINLTALSEKEKSVIHYLVESKILNVDIKPGQLTDIASLKSDYPTEFSWIEVTRQCNMACPFCYESSSPHCYERMSLEDFKLVVENLKSINVKRIQFIGGEPTILKDDLKKMITYCRDDFEFIEVYSNGMLINEAWCEFFKEYKIQLALSIHSYIPEEHDKHVEYVGSHKKVTRAVKLLRKYGVPFRVGTVKSNSCKIGEASSDDQYQINKPDNPRITGRADIEQYDFNMFESKAITKASKRFPLTKESVSRFVSGHQCFMRDLYIDTKLDVYPCVMERRTNYGNLKEMPLKNMMDNKLRYLSKDNIQGCQDCEYRYGCFDCRPDSNGREIFQKPWYCSYNSKKGEWMDLKNMFTSLQKQGKTKVSSIQTIPIQVENSNNN